MYTILIWLEAFPYFSYQKISPQDITFDIRNVKKKYVDLI